MLLLGELSRIKLDPVSKTAKLANRQPFLPRLTKREGEQLDNRRLKSNCRLSHGEELVDETLDDDKEKADGPRANRACWRGRVVFVADYCADFCVGRVDSEKRNFGLDV